MQHDIEEMKNNPTITDEEGQQVLEDARKNCTFTLIVDGKPVKREYFFVPKKDLRNGNTARAYAVIMRNSIVCQKFMNILKWAAKVTIQTDRNAIYKNVNSRLMDMLKDCPDANVYNEFTNSERINAVRREGGAKLEAELRKSIIAPIHHMITVIENIRLKESTTK